MYFFGLIHTVICSIGRPSDGISVDSTSEGDEGGYLGYGQCRGRNDRHAWCCRDQQNEENDSHRDPGKALIAMNVLVAVDAKKRRHYCNDENADLSGNSSSTERIYQLSTHNHVDSRPTNACCNIEEYHHHRTNPTEREPRNGHLTEAEFGAEC